MSESAERRRNQALRRRIDQLLGRVRAAEAEIVERGLSAVHDTPGPYDPDVASGLAAPDPAIAPGETAERRA
jgi:hypothetical protein